MNTNTFINNTIQAVPFPTNHLNLRRPVQWDETLQQLIEMKEQRVSFDKATLANLRSRLECNPTPLNVLEQLITMYPQELGFSILLSATRFRVHSNNLMDDIFAGIKKESEANMDYCIIKFQGHSLKARSDHTIIGEAMTLIFSFFDDFIATPQSGNLEALQIVKRAYPKSILYVDAHGFTPLHGACCALNLDIFKFFIKWHLEQSPLGRGGLYEMNDSGITSLDTLIDTQTNIDHILQWLCNRGLLKSNDVNSELLIHRAAHSSSISTIRFFLDLFPSGVLSEDSDGNLPIHLHLGLRYRQHNSFTDEDFAISKLLIKYGILHGMNTIGGLFHTNPDDNKCTLMSLLEGVGVNNSETVWSIIKSCLAETVGGEYSNAPIIHAAIYNKQFISNELFKELITRFGVEGRRNEDGELPLQYALKNGLGWADGISDILEASPTTINEINYETDLEKTDLSSLYEFNIRKPNLCLQRVVGK